MGAVFEHPVDVRWRDVDALDHVNHAVFLTYLEEGRDAFFAQTLGSDPSYVVVRIEVDLRAEVRLADRQVVVRIAAERLGTTSLTTRETITTPSGETSESSKPTLRAALEIDSRSGGTSFDVGTRWRSTASSRSYDSASAFIFDAVPFATSSLVSRLSESSVSSRTSMRCSSWLFGVQTSC